MQGIQSLLFDSNLEVAPLFFFIRVRLINIRSVIVDLSDSDFLELLPKDFPRNEKNSVIFVRVEANTFLLILVHLIPDLIVVRPSTFKLTLSPRISQLSQLDLLPLKIQIIHFHESVSVTLYHTRFTCIFI